MDTLDEQVTVTLREVSPSEAAVGEHEVTGEQHAAVRCVQTDVVVLVARRVENLVPVVAEFDGIARLEFVVDGVVAGVETPDVDAERLPDLLEIADVVVMRVGQHQGVDVIDVFANRRRRIEPAAGVDQNGPLASDQKGVARHPTVLDVEQEIAYHDSTYGEGRFGPAGSDPVPTDSTPQRSDSSSESGRDEPDDTVRPGRVPATTAREWGRQGSDGIRQPFYHAYACTEQMSSCIICGTSVDGHVCSHHEEDVVFEFQGTEAEQLTPSRYYRGTVDGFAEFGIFVNIGESVTGLLHRSELDRRLESIDLETGETVFVQVQNVRDNGDIDLGWSIRQDPSRFRGTLIDDPEGDRQPDEETRATGDSEVVRTSADPESGESNDHGGRSGRSAESTAESDHSEGADERSRREGDDGTSGASDAEVQTGTAADSGESAETTGAPGEESDTQSSSTDGDEAGERAGESTEHGRSEPESATVAALEDHVGERVRLEGIVDSARQTSGPTVFELRDETGTIECAAFEAAGVRAYPDVEEGELVRIDGEPERHRGELQVETNALVVLEGEEREGVVEGLDAALRERARPETVTQLAADELVEERESELLTIATAVRRAVIEGRPVVVRHAGTVDGYVASAAIERAVLPLVREHGEGADDEYHLFERRPIEGSAYDMDDATRDVTQMLAASERHDEPVPLFLFVAAGSPESADGFDLLEMYDAERILLEDRPAVPELRDAVQHVLEPDEPTTVTRLAANLAATIGPDVSEQLHHLPAVSAWGEVPEAYTDLARDAGYDTDEVEMLREALALVTHYQAYEDKRELVADLLFDGAHDLAEHISEEFDTRMGTAIETAEANLERQGDPTVLVLDTQAYTHRYDFPPVELLLDTLYRHHSEEIAAVVGVGRDECHVRSDAGLDVMGLVEDAREHAPAAGLDARGARDGRIEFLSGEREHARDALLEALETRLTQTA